MLSFPIQVDRVRVRLRLGEREEDERAQKKEDHVRSPLRPGQPQKQDRGLQHLTSYNFTTSRMVYWKVAWISRLALRSEMLRRD